MKNVYRAIAEFQQECPIIHKDTQGYGYTYADLPKIFEVIMPLLKKHGLGFTQPIRGIEIETCIFHIESGEYLTATAQLPQNVELKGMNNFQVAGSAITYFRRYALSSMLGIVTDKDLDAAGEQVANPKKEVPKKAPVTPQFSEQTYQDDPFEGLPITPERVMEKFGGQAVNEKTCVSCKASFIINPGEDWKTTCKKCYAKSKA